MKLAHAAVAVSAFLALEVAAQGHIRCQNTIGGPCGDSSRPREMNCCDYGYCQPWNAGYYQCLDKPARCPQQETDIDYFGNDLNALFGILPDACCNACSTTPGCKGYTFVNENPDGKAACYLKSAMTGRVEKKGAVSGFLQPTDPTPTPSPPPTATLPPPCPNALGAYCGNAQQWSCCQGLAYCQPWNAGYYQCVEPLPFCGPTHTDVDFYGDDIKTLFGLLPGACCQECARTPDCRAITFVNENPDGKSACYLKRGGGTRVAKKGAVSSTLLYDPPPTPTPTPAPPTCSNGVGSPCGNAKTGAACCASGSYCQPWNQWYYQCVALPAKCYDLAVGVDLYGDDLETRYDLLPDTCCDACVRHDKCQTFTFVNENADGRSACYLKSGAGTKKPHAGAVSGYKYRIVS